LGDSDIDNVRLTVAQTDWKPSGKPPAPPMDPGALLNGILGATTAPASDKQ
jgi:hypothetical protein